MPRIRGSRSLVQPQAWRVVAQFEFVSRRFRSHHPPLASVHKAATGFVVRLCAGAWLLTSIPVTSFSEIGEGGCLFLRRLYAPTRIAAVPAKDVLWWCVWRAVPHQVKRRRVLFAAGGQRETGRQSRDGPENTPPQGGPAPKPSTQRNPSGCPRHPDTETNSNCATTK